MSGRGSARVAAPPGPGGSSGPGEDGSVTTTGPRTPRAAIATACAVAFATLAFLIATEPGLAIVWDEGFALGREARIRLWVRALRDPAGFASRWQPPTLELVQQDSPPPAADRIDTRAKLFRPEVMAWFWPFAREEPHGHPPFYALVGLIGDLLAPSWSTLPRARLGPMLAFSLTAGVLASFARSRWGGWPASVAVAAWVFQPNLFANAHYATLDGVLSCLWLLGLIAFAEAMTRPPTSPTDPPLRWGWVVAFGVVVGWAADTKLTGWFLPIPLIAWTLLRRDRRGIRTLLAGALVAGATLLAFNPAWWLAPVDGVRRFLVSNLTRGRTIPIPVLFLGHVYQTPNQSLPWYNTLVWTVLVTPVGFLILAVVGALRGFCRVRDEPLGLLAVGHWWFLLVLRALPHTPGHDGVRQFLPAFGVLALVSGLGAASVVGRLGRLGKFLVAAAMAEGVLAVAMSWPVPLSYFSPAIGGLPGAARLGMEPTYFWDGLSSEAIDWLNERTPPGGKVRFATFPTSWLYLRSQGRLKPEILPGAPGAWTWYVLQNRPGAFGPIDRALADRGNPAFVVARSGVPLVWIFPFAEVERLARDRRPQ